MGGNINLNCACWIFLTLTSTSAFAQSTPNSADANISPAARSSSERNLDSAAVRERETSAQNSGPAGLRFDLAKVPFEQLDRDGNGEITDDERSSDPFMTEKRFHGIDSDANGRIDQFEYGDFQDRIEEEAEDIESAR